MRIKATIIALVLSASVGCGGEKDKNKGTEQKAPKAVTNKADLAKLEAVSAEMPRLVLAREAVVNGKATGKVEMVSVPETMTINYENPAAVQEIFEKGEPVKDVVAADDLDGDSSSSQFCCGGWNRGFYWSRTRVVYRAGFGGFFRPFWGMGGCCGVYQTGCGVANSYHRYWGYSSGYGAGVGGPGYIQPGPIVPGPGVGVPGPGPELVQPGVDNGGWYEDGN